MENPKGKKTQREIEKFHNVMTIIGMILWCARISEFKKLSSLHRKGSTIYTSGKIYYLYK